MARDISIAISAKDNFSSAITTMRNANQSFSKDVTGLQSKLDILNKTKITLKVDVNKAKNELREAENQFAKTGKAADKLKLEMANANYENARRNLSLVSDNAKQAEKDIRSLTNAVSKSENKAATAKSATTGIVGALAASGAASLVGNSIASIANVGISSAYGQEAGLISNSVLSTGAMGAAIGSAIAPGIGTAVGALGGAILGYIQGRSAIFENKDEAFKSYYQDLYNDVLGTQSQALTSGSGLASIRESNKISFSTLLGGDDKASDFLGSLTDFAATTPFAYDELTNISKVLLAYGYKQEELLPLLEKVGDAGSALGMKPEDMQYVATALGRMQTTGKTTMEYLNPLLERGIDVWTYLSEASGKSKKEVQEMVSKGLVPGEKAAKAIADYMGFNFDGNMEKQSQTYAGLVSTLEDANAELNNAMGEGYNSTRKGGLQEQIDFLGGESGTQMQDAYNKIGQWKASLENLSEQYQRDALNSVMSGTVSAEFSPEMQAKLTEMYEEYTRYAADGSEEAGTKMGALLAEAQAIAQNEYNASEGARLALESNKTLAENIKNDTAAQETYWDAGYTMGQQFTNGMVSALEQSESEAMKVARKNAPNISALMELTPEEAAEMAGMATKKDKPRNAGTAPNISSIMNLTPEQIINGSYAYGLSNVPYDNYPALLHQGERVLTASENRNYGSGVQVSITGNNFNVRNEDDIEKIGDIVAVKVAQQMNQALLLGTN